MAMPAFPCHRMTMARHTTGILLALARASTLRLREHIAFAHARDDEKEELRYERNDGFALPPFRERGKMERPRDTVKKQLNDNARCTNL